MAADSNFVDFKPRILKTLSRNSEPVDLVTYQDHEYVVKYLRLTRYGLLNPNEVHIGSGISHPNLGRIDYLFPQKSSRNLGIVMPRYRHDAVSLLSVSKIDVDLRLTMFYQLISVVHQLHKSGFVHLDIKPGNMVIEDERIILIDFGSSRRLLDGKYIAHNSVMTPGFNPPEDVHGIFKYTTATDVWSLAATGVFLLTNRNLVPRDVKSQSLFMNDIKVNVRSILYKRFEFWPEHPSKDPIISILSSMLAYEPTHRAELTSVLSNPIWKNTQPVESLIMLNPPRIGNVSQEFVTELTILVDFFRLKFSFASARCLFLAADLAYRSVDNLHAYLSKQEAAPRRRLFIAYVCTQLAIDTEMTSVRSKRQLRDDCLDFFLDRIHSLVRSGDPGLKKDHKRYASKILDVVLTMGLQGVIYLPSVYDSVCKRKKLRQLVDTHILNPENYNAWTKTTPVTIDYPYTGDIASLFSN